MAERRLENETETETARNFIDNEFLSHADQDLVDYRVEKHINLNENMTPSFVRNLYGLYVRESLESFQDSGKALERDATNLAILRKADSRLPEGQNTITVSDELALFRNSLTSVLYSELWNIEERIAAHGAYDDIGQVRGLLTDILGTINNINFLSTYLPPHE